MAKSSQCFKDVSLLKGGDIFTIVLFLGSFLFSLTLFASKGENITSVTVRHGTTLLLEFPIVDTVVIVEGDVGKVTVAVVDGAVTVTESSCPHQICVRAPSLKSEGSIICIPNRVSVDAHGEKGGVDATVR